MSRGDYHYGFIETKRKNINQVLCAKSYDILQSIVFCIYAGPEHEAYSLNLLAASMNLHNINCLIYKGKDGYVKLPKRKYEIELFEGYAETVEEVQHILQRLGFTPTGDEVRYVYNVLYAMKPLILEWLTLTCEIAYAPEFAYHIDYCIRNKVEQLPEPEVDLIYPVNYPADYELRFDEGVVGVIDEIVGFH